MNATVEPEVTLKQGAGDGIITRSDEVTRELRKVTFEQDAKVTSNAVPLAPPVIPQVTLPTLPACPICRGPVRSPKRHPAWVRVRADGVQEPIHETCARNLAFLKLRIIEDTVEWRPARGHRRIEQEAGPGPGPARSALRSTVRCRPRSRKSPASYASFAATPLGACRTAAVW